MITIATITDEQIRTLRSEALAVGDRHLAANCDIALGPWSAVSLGGRLVTRHDAYAACVDALNSPNVGRAPSFDSLCVAAGRRILESMSTEEREANELDLTDPRHVCCYVAGMLTVERQSFKVTLSDVDKRVKELAASANAQGGAHGI